ncbi:zinc finger MYM-type protein 1-like [Venturia canescens]|uniref:zinc finger MYM-type protein 1-like n=1 Tax=Venturia canescens TaxID=32260 RepID=UPI001C9BE8B4|nr:zinc finger MYM-type protein 1-like [Venturia canescens]
MMECEEDKSKDTGMNNAITREDDPLNTAVNIKAMSDVSRWNIPLPDSLRIEIIKKGSNCFQNKDGPFGIVVRQGPKTKGGIRNLSKEWFYKEMPSGEKILRSWMVYSPRTNNLYCFCCRMFATSSTDAITFVSGFQKWWKLNPKVMEHEVTTEHLENLEKWKTLETRLRLHKTIDHATLQMMDAEKKKWRGLLVRLLDITLFLAKQNLAFRGHEEGDTSMNKGNFLELVQLLSKYDAVLKEHLLSLEHSPFPKVSYLSPEIQNEFISVLSNHVKCTLIEEIKSARYFGMIFDSTPDVSHTDQMSQVIRFVKIDNRKVEVKEVFLGFFPLKGKKAADLSDEILQKLESDGLDIMLCRSQGYDNAATMSGVHGGVQTIIKSKNRKAVFF